MKVITEQEYMELLEMLRESFASLEQKLEHRFDKIEQRLDRIEQRLDYHETWLKRIDTTINNNLVQKKDFNTLINILENHSLISAPEAIHFLSTK